MKGDCGLDPEADTPPGPEADTPLDPEADTAPNPEADTPAVTRPLKQAVHVLLECILVAFKFVTCQPGLKFRKGMNHVLWNMSVFQNKLETEWISVQTS